jgi:hypothetical protein
MKRNVSAVLGAAVMVLWASAASAQAKFDGKWAVDMEKTQAANPAMQGGGGGGGGGNRQMAGGAGMGGGAMVITATEISTTRPGPEGDVTTTYKLDGSEQTVNMGRGDAKVKATRDADKITVVTTRETPNGAMTTTAVYTIEGDNLVIATTSPARGGGEPMTRKVFYKKAG